MKKVLLLLCSLVFGQICFAYETVIVDFPVKEGWHSVYYQTQGNESILQYVPKFQTYESWSRTLIFHSYKNQDAGYNYNSQRLFDNTLSEMENRNSSGLYKYRKYTDVDSIATRCVSANAKIKSQCEIFRSAQSHEGVITMHYINKNKQDFREDASRWFQIMKDIRIYYSYWRNDRVLNKATVFEI